MTNNVWRGSDDWMLDVSTGEGVSEGTVSGSDDQFLRAVEALEIGTNRLGESLPSSNSSNPTSSGTSFQGGENYFLQTEASVSDSSSSASSSASGSGYESSFVDDNDISISESQQGVYLRSVMEASPQPIRRECGRPLVHFVDDTEYEIGSFCNDDVEYESVGAFSHAMNAARQEVLGKNGDSNETVTANVKKYKRIIVYDDSNDDLQ